MPWANTTEDRRRSNATYDNPEYRRNKAIVRRRSGGRCEHVEDGKRCGSRDRVQCDHKVNVRSGGTHALANLWDLCHSHHSRKTAQEGMGFRRVKDPEPTPRTTW